MKFKDILKLAGATGVAGIILYFFWKGVLIGLGVLIAAYVLYTIWINVFPENYSDIEESDYIEFLFRFKGERFDLTKEAQSFYDWEKQLGDFVGDKKLGELDSSFEGDKGIYIILYTKNPTHALTVLRPFLKKSPFKPIALTVRTASKGKVAKSVENIT